MQRGWSSVTCQAAVRLTVSKIVNIRLAPEVQATVLQASFHSGVRARAHGRRRCWSDTTIETRIALESTNAELAVTAAQ